MAVADTDGSDVRAYPRTESLEEPKTPSWSPDGSTIVYQAKGIGPEVGDLFLLDVGSGQVRQLTELEPVSDYYPLMSPTFGPGGDSVVFALPASRGPVGWDLWSIPVAGGDPTLVRRDAGLVDASPDGERITFVDIRIEDGEFTTGDLWVANADGSDAESDRRRTGVGEPLVTRWDPDPLRRRDGRRAEGPRPGVRSRRCDVPSAADGSDWLDDGTLIVDAR